MFIPLEIFPCFLKSPIPVRNMTCIAIHCRSRTNNNELNRQMDKYIQKTRPTWGLSTLMCFLGVCRVMLVRSFIERRIHFRNEGTTLAITGGHNCEQYLENLKTNKNNTKFRSKHKKNLEMLRNIGVKGKGWFPIILFALRIWEAFSVISSQMLYELIKFYGGLFIIPTWKELDSKIGSSLACNNEYRDRQHIWWPCKDDS